MSSAFIRRSFMVAQASRTSCMMLNNQTTKRTIHSIQRPLFTPFLRTQTSSNNNNINVSNQQQQRHVQTRTNTVAPHKKIRVALLLSDPQNNILLIQKAQLQQQRSTENLDKQQSHISQVPSLLLKSQLHDDPRKAIVQYANEELWLDVDEQSILPFTVLESSSMVATEEQVLVYFVKVKRYFDPEAPLLDERGAPLSHLVLPKERQLVIQHFTEDQIVRNLSTNVYNTAELSAQRNQAQKQGQKQMVNLVDTLSVAILGKYIAERQENMYEAKSYFMKLRYGIVSFLLGAGFMTVLIGASF